MSELKKLSADLTTLSQLEIEEFILSYKFEHLVAQNAYSGKRCSVRASLPLRLVCSIQVRLINWR